MDTSVCHQDVAATCVTTSKDPTDMGFIATGAGTDVSAGRVVDPFDRGSDVGVIPPGGL